MLNKKKIFAFFSLILLLGMVAACSSSTGSSSEGTNSGNQDTKNETGNGTENLETITLKVADSFP